MTQMSVLKKSDVDGGLPEAGLRPGADSGNPTISVRTLAPETGSNIGVWECQPGGWPVVSRADTEVCYLLSGTAKITDDATGEVHTVTAGDLVVLPTRWSGRWDVTETVRKVYAIYK